MNNPSLITLLTDFGISDPYVAMMKGVILSVNPIAKIVDITHDIKPQDIVGAARMIHSCYRYFPRGTIHVAVVDPGVGGSRSIIAVKADGYYFLAPDNGILSLIIDPNELESIVKVENKDLFLKPVSNTFHGRDIFAPVAGYLSKEMAFKQLGSPVLSENVIRLNIPSPITDKDQIIGEVTKIDRFGNVITNIHQDDINILCTNIPRENWIVQVGQNRIDGLSLSYQEGAPDHLIGIIGSAGFLEISMNCGSAADFCKARVGDRVDLTCRGSGFKTPSNIQ